MMNLPVYETPFYIYTHLCDRYYRLSIPATAQLFQEVAELHSNTVGSGFQTLLERGRVWVLSKVSYRYIGRYPRLDEEVKLRTWSRGSDSLIAHRDFQIISKMGEILLACTSTWVVMDLHTRRVCRHQEEMKCYTTHEERALNFDAQKVEMPDTFADSESQPCAVEFSSIDKAQHVNNAEYLRWFTNKVPVQLLEKGPLAIDINYLRETRPDDNATLCFQIDGNQAWFRSSTDRGICVNCHMTFNE